MLSLTGTLLLVLLIVLALGGPVALGLTWRRFSGRVLGVVARIGIVLVCQVLAVAAVGVGVNRAYVFYDSWGDLLGRPADPVKVTQNGQLVPADGSQGRVEFLNVQGRVSGVTQQVLIWLPPEYDQNPKATFPVLLALPGYPGTTTGIFRTFDLPRNALAAVASGETKPFVAVIAGLDVAPPRDTECTDIPKGPQADAWLATDVREAVVGHYRVAAKNWSTLGWSTGGFCAAKMLLRHPTSFGGAASIGAYFTADEDDTTGSLFGGDAALRDQNSPLYLLQHTRTYPVHLLVVVAKGDYESWSGASYANAKETVAAGTGVPGFSAIVLPTGGHNFTTYAPTIEPSLAWLGHNAGL
jgi:enterochelin esterase-like enzyme